MAMGLPALGALARLLPPASRSTATNLQRVLLRRDVLEQTGESRASGRAGGRQAALFRFRRQRLEISDQFAVLRPPADREVGST
jgi:hypothetical protein